MSKMRWWEDTHLHCGEGVVQYKSFQIIEEVFMTEAGYQDCQPSNTWPSLRNYYNVLPDVTMLDSTVTWKPPKKISVKFIYSRQKIDSSYLDDRWLQTEELGGLEGFPSILPTNLHI